MGGGASKESPKAADKAASQEKKDPAPATTPDAAPVAATSAESKTEDTSAESKTEDTAESKTETPEIKKPAEEEQTVEETAVEPMPDQPGDQPDIKRAESIGDIYEGEQHFNLEQAQNAGAALGNIFKKKADKPMTENKALVFDCGTGETKAIFLQYYLDGDKPVVAMKELGKAPATLDFLKGKKASDNEDYKTKCKHCETNLDKRGRKVFDTDEELEAARNSLNDGYWFLEKKPEGATDILKPQYFVDFCVQTKKKLIADGNPPDTVMIGCSAWARDAGAYQKDADDLVVELTKAGLLCKKLLQTQEGAFEAAAVAYAYNAMLSAGPADVRLPSGLIGSGGGSVQFMNNMVYPVNMDCGNRMCLEAMGDAYDDSSVEAGLASLEACFAQSDSFASKENVSTNSLHGRVHGEIEEERLRTTEEFAGDDVANKAINTPLAGHIIAISACYYGAMSIGKANKKDLDMQEYPCKQILEEMYAKIVEDKKVLREGKHTDRKARGTLFKEIANLTLQTCLFSTLFAPDAMLCFKRNWTLNGIPFRTTWTAGWYLNFLYGLNIHFPGSDSTLKKYAETQAKARTLLAEAGDRLGGEVNDDVAMVLVDMKTVIRGMRSLALQIANPIDNFLKGITDKFKGNMYGWPRFKIKGTSSLYRKLIGTIFDMLKENEDVPNYTPNIEDCVASIHDCLRYTVTFPPEEYTAAVKAIEQQLLAPEDGDPIAKSIRFKNFWRDKDGETTYQGINAQVCLNAVQDLQENEEPVDNTPEKDEGDGYTYTIPKPTGKTIPNSDNFIFELQIHTPQSYAMKDGPGHLLYEDFRDPAVKKGSVKGKAYDGTDDRGQYYAFKEALYKANKELWRTKKDDGTPLAKGDPVCTGLKTTAHHKWTEDDYTFEPYKPDPPIAFYESQIEGAGWENRMQINKKLEAKLTGMPHPYGRRV